MEMTGVKATHDVCVILFLPQSRGLAYQGAMNVDNIQDD